MCCELARSCCLTLYPPTCASVCFYLCHCSGVRYCDRDADSQHDVLIFQHFRLSLHSQIRSVCFAPIFCSCLIRLCRIELQWHCSRDRTVEIQESQRVFISEQVVSCVSFYDDIVINGNEVSADSGYAFVKLTTRRSDVWIFLSKNAPQRKFNVAHA